MHYVGAVVDIHSRALQLRQCGSAAAGDGEVRCVEGSDQLGEQDLSWLLRVLSG